MRNDMAVRTATNENRQAAAKGQKNVRKPLRLRTLGIMASRIRKHRQTRLKGYRLTFRRDIFRHPDERNPGPDTRRASVADTARHPFPPSAIDSSA
ncbi:hypothetical protein [Burkholderia sp. BCC1977]|uniref:hypothetical protein n=1 Tax=Burkholderia sp. BCC1977 TaxID=2817440 RepID=UPI002ABDC6FC|nr:hypothetical protein [Burkholderia sp. BCC1977]